MNKSKIGQINKELTNAREVLVMLQDPKLTKYGQSRHIKELLLIVQDINGLVTKLKEEVES